MKVVGQWRRLQQTSTVASYFDYVFRLQAMCSMQKDADFRLAFYGLRPELQGEVRRYMRRNELQTLSLERLYEVAVDAELSTGCCEQTDNPYMITGYEGRLFVYHVCIERQSKHYVWIERTSAHMDVWIERMSVHRDGIERMPCTGVWIERQLVHIVG